MASWFYNLYGNVEDPADPKWFLRAMKLEDLHYLIKVQKWRGWDQHKDSSVKLGNGRGSRHGSTHLWSIDFQQKCRVIQPGKGESCLKTALETGYPYGKN